MTPIGYESTWPASALAGVLLRAIGSCAFAPPPQLRVDAAPRGQIVVRAFLGKLALVHHRDAIRARCGREPMRDSQHRAAPGAGRWPFRPAPRLAVERRRGLVEDQDRRIANHRTRDRDQLPLSSRQLLAKRGTEVSYRSGRCWIWSCSPISPATASISSRWRSACRAGCSRGSSHRTGTPPGGPGHLAPQRLLGTARRSCPSIRTRPPADRGSGSASSRPCSCRTTPPTRTIHSPSRTSKLTSARLRRSASNQT